ncbi:RlmE family RNA methyltransferase [Acidiferrobacter sp.]|uniref:RlmE family RNA methyltransferase n=1 Tax=Acidiferrobacter sp. TaxID=1872107 RepID=UPI00262FA466|nr:RlmE family RNA methyltransferase [Acidiferrobacter sp.]
MARNRWMDEHFADPYVKRAQAEGYRSRAAYKLMEIDARDRLIRQGQVIADLGCAPGGFAQYAARRLGPAGRLVAVDVLPMDPVPGVVFIQGDFTEPACYAAVRAALQGPADLVISDMAPNITGIEASDQARAVALAEIALDFAVSCLTPEGSCLIKVFQGAGFPELLADMRRRFQRVATRKPPASRPRSPEVYLLGTGLRPVVSGSES